MYIYHNFVITQNCNTTKQNELLQKKKSKQRWGEKLMIYFSESAPLPWIFIFVTLPLQILEKTSFHPGNSAKICDIPSNFKSQGPWKFHINSTGILEWFSFNIPPWKFHVLNPPPPFLFVCFSGIAQYNLIAVEAFIPVSAVAFHDFKNVWKRYHVSWEGYIWYIFAILLLRLKRSTVEVRENGFYFISKAFLVFEILKF